MNPEFSFVYKKMLDPFWSSSLTPLYSHSNSSLRKDLESAGFTLENPVFTIFFSLTWCKQHLVLHSTAC